VQIQELLHHSAAADIVDVTAYVPAEKPEQVALTLGSIAFVRTGVFVKDDEDAAAIVDANYVVFGTEGGFLRAQRCGTEICACTIIRCDAATAAVPAGSCALTSPAAFLAYAQLVQSARMGMTGVDAEVLALLCRIPADLRPPYACAHSPLVNEIRRLANESISRRITLSDLASAFYLSPFTLSRLFRRETGVSLRSYVIRLRLRKALTMLLYTRASLTEIALELGFYDESHFSKAFHVEFGIPPYNVRKYWTKSDFC
jgi:AraC-like DNA-binding protein